jgi:WD40 repeat protein
MVWDIRGFKLLRILDQHAGPVLSVSINPVNGYIFTLTARELRVYTINGDLLATSSMTDPSNTKPKAKVVMSLPIGEWQDGFIAVTGHDAGHVYLWKMAIRTAAGQRPADDGSTMTGGNASTSGHKVYREFEPFPLPKTHRSEITVLRLCSPFTSKSKELLPRVYEGENSYELLIGDSEGYASRWAPGKLEQLSPSELQRRAAEMTN